jgi:hypothetical protein
VSRYTLDIIAILLTVAICVPLVEPLFNTQCMDHTAIGVYEKITMAVIAILAGYIGAVARDRR